MENLFNIKIGFNLEKFNEATAFMLENSAQGGQPEAMGFHKFMKLLFFAEVIHLNNYYSPFIGGDYVAMRFGPVHSQAYNVLKDNSVEVDEEEFELLFNIDGKKITLKDNYPANTPNAYRRLSKADKESIKESIKKYGGMNFTQLTNESHQHPAWLKAVRKDPNSLNPIMDYRDFFDEKLPNDVIDEICGGYSIAV